MVKVNHVFCISVIYLYVSCSYLSSELTQNGKVSLPWTLELGLLPFDLATQLTILMHDFDILGLENNGFFGGMFVYIIGWIIIV